MFEKEAIIHAFEETIGIECLNKPVEDFTYEELSDELQEKAYDFKKGAEFGYNKCKEELNQKGLALQSDMDKTIEQNIALKKELNNVKKWYYVKDGDYPKKKGIYLVAWERTHHVEEYGEWGFDVDVFNADDGYFEGCGDFVIAWKEITIPEFGLQGDCNK